MTPAPRASLAALGLLLPLLKPYLPRVIAAIAALLLAAGTAMAAAPARLAVNRLRRLGAIMKLCCLFYVMPICLRDWIVV